MWISIALWIALWNVIVSESQSQCESHGILNVSKVFTYRVLVLARIGCGLHWIHSMVLVVDHEFGAGHSGVWARVDAGLKWLLTSNWWWPQWLLTKNGAAHSGCWPRMVLATNDVDQWLLTSGCWPKMVLATTGWCWPELLLTSIWGLPQCLLISKLVLTTVVFDPDWCWPQCLLIMNWCLTKVLTRNFVMATMVAN